MRRAANPNLWQTDGMLYRTNFNRLATLAPLLLLSAALISCAEKEPEPIVLSERPAAINELTSSDAASDASSDNSIEKFNTEIQQSKISTRTRISYADLESLLEKSIPATHTDVDQKKICKRVLGIKLCGTANWNYTIVREDSVNIKGEDNFVVLTTPMRFSGQGGISGDVAKVLALDALDFKGALNIVARLHFDLDESWCPVVTTNVQYQWTENPKVKWAAGIDFNVKEQIDGELTKQLAGLQEKVNAEIDCEKFRTQISEQWKSHSIKLDLPQAQSSYLNFFPTGFSFSGINTEQDHLGIAFTLDAETIVQAEAVIETREALPPVKRNPYQPGFTRFDIVIHADYEQLHALASPSLTGKTFTQQSKAGDVSVEVQNILLSGNTSGVTIELDFTALLPGKSQWTKGTAYMVATPAINISNGTLYLKDIALSNAVDSRPYDLLLTLFNKQIVDQLNKQAVLDLTPYFIELENKIAQQLNNTERTGGLEISANDINVELRSVKAESKTLAAVLRVEATLDIDIPATVFDGYLENQELKSGN